MLTGPGATTPILAYEAFWHKALLSAVADTRSSADMWAATNNIIKTYAPKETPMSTFDYRRGVEDAIRLAKVHNLGNNYGDPVLAHICEVLLPKKTKKVTRWLNVYQGPNRGIYPSSCLWNTKEGAETDGSTNRIGTYPVEIDVSVE